MQEEYTYLCIRSIKEICELAGRVNCTTICCKYLYALYNEAAAVLLVHT